MVTHLALVMLAFVVANILTFLYKPCVNMDLFSSMHRTTSRQGHGVSDKDVLRPDGRMFKINLVKSPVPSVGSLTRTQYARLATYYLRHFETTGVNRTQLLQAFWFNTSFCTACVWVQVKDGCVYVYDPRAVRYSMATFRAQRLREALHFIGSAVRRGVVGDFELLLSVMDSVASTHVCHDYRLPIPSSPIIPIFTPVSCNVSTDIPFPMMLTDVLRRAFPRQFGVRQSGTLNQWDDVMTHFANNESNRIAWRRKKRRAVFRGAVRISASVPTVEGADKLCNVSGRTALWAVAQSKLQDYEDQRWSWSFTNKVDSVLRNAGLRIWLKAFDRNKLDVELQGTCGGRIFTARRLTPAQQMENRIIIHAEGNSFWADRLLLTLFGTSVIMKQSVPCGMFFEPLLRPFTHYIPVDTRFQYARTITDWILERDSDMSTVVGNARELAATFLSLGAVQTYVDEVLWRYANLSTTKQFEILPAAVQIYPRLE